ncbi:hypothetical protein L1887_11036 [Cichorium endivia]|nr:hypothetical protein L1887_11036 [Cichorium endivia]
MFNITVFVLFQETITFNSNSDFIVFPPSLIAIHLLYSAPGELWNWDHPKPRHFPANHTISARDGILIPTSPDDIIHSKEYTCVVSNKDSYPLITERCSFYQVFIWVSSNHREYECGKQEEVKEDVGLTSGG